MMTNRRRKLADIDVRLNTLKSPHPDADCLYHAITLTADENLKVTFGTCSEWVGWTDDTMRHELRQSRLVYADYAKTWEKIGLPYAFVLNVDDLTMFMLGGGNALVEKELAESVFPKLLKADPVVSIGPQGFKSKQLFDESAFRRAPTPRLRMDIFKRDGRRCKICGRKPGDNSDLELHLHHIRPWAKGGVTDPSNLITLCHTCHNGLKPHDDFSLYEYLEDKVDDRVQAYLIAFSNSVANYRRVGFFGDIESAEAPTQRRRKLIRKPASKSL
jgi:hypothetical protein